MKLCASMLLVGLLIGVGWCTKDHGTEKIKGKKPHIVIIMADDLVNFIISQPEWLNSIADFLLSATIMKTY